MRHRTWFALAVDGFIHVIDGLRDADLTQPGLGEWDLRALLGHTTRALLTTESYLRAGDQAAVPVLGSPTAYFHAAAGGLADPTQVVDRGRNAGAALGAHPLAAALEIAQRVTAMVNDSPDDALVATPVGPMTLMDYLPTRAFELTVHGIDLARATEQPVPSQLVDAAVFCVALLADIAAPSDRVTALLALTGRSGLPTEFTLL